MHCTLSRGASRCRSFVRSFVLLRNFVAKLAAVAAASLLSVHAALLVINFILLAPERFSTLSVLLCKILFGILSEIGLRSLDFTKEKLHAQKHCEIILL